MERHLTRRNVLLLLTGVFLLIAWNRAINLLYVMFALLSAVLILSFLLPRQSLRRITAQRQFPDRAFEGDEIEARVTMQNDGRIGRYMIEVVDCIPGPPGLEHPMTFIAWIAGRKRREFTFKASCYLRGEYVVGPLALRSAYPLGIWSVEKALPETTQPLLIYPEVFPIASFPLLAGSNAPVGGSEVLSRVGGSDEFFGTREYRRGDSPRYIHWPSTARHMQLIVKEFEITAFSEMTILMDFNRASSVGEGKENTLEYAVKIAASISRHVLEKGHTVQMIGYGKEPCIIPYGKGVAQNARVLEALARIRADGDVPFPQAISRCADLLKEGGAVVLLFTRAAAWRLDDCLYSLSLLKTKRASPIGIFIDETTFSNGASPRGSGLQGDLVGWFTQHGAPVYRVSRGDSLEGVFAS